MLDPGALDPSEELSLAGGGGAARPVLADGVIKSGRLAGMTMRRAIWVLSWPILAQSFLQSLVGLVDTVLAAGVSEAATDAIGGASYFLWFVGLVMMAIGVGATALIARAVGAGKLAVANAALGQSILAAVVSGVGVGGLIVLLAQPGASILSMTEEARRAFWVFMAVNALGVPTMSVLFCGTEAMRAAGDSLRPMRIMVIVNVVNLVVSWSLAGIDLTVTSVADGVAATRVLVSNPFPFDMGVMGIALGTVIAHTVGAVMAWRVLSSGACGIVLRRRRLRPHWHTLRRILRVGLPNFLETFGMWVGNFAVLIMVGWLAVAGLNGSSAPAEGGYIGAHIVAIRIESFSFLPGFAMGAAAATLAGQYLGAGSARMAKRATMWCTAIAAAMMGVIGLAFVAVPERIVGLLSSQPAHLSLAPTLLFIAGIVQAPFAVAIVLRSAMRGAGDVKVVMYATWVTTYLVRLPLAYALCGVDIPLPASLGGGVIPNPFWTGDGERWGLTGLWVGLCAELLVRAAIFGARYLHGGWLKARV